MEERVWEHFINRQGCGLIHHPSPLGRGARQGVRYNSPRYLEAETVSQLPFWRHLCLPSVQE